MYALLLVPACRGHLLVVTSLLVVDGLVELSTHEIDVALKNTVVLEHPLHVLPALSTE